MPSTVPGTGGEVEVVTGSLMELMFYWRKH